MRGIQRIICGWLAICMVFSMLPMQVFATETEPTVETIAAETVPEESVSETTAPTEAPPAPSEAEPEPTEEPVVPTESETEPTEETTVPTEAATEPTEETIVTAETVTEPTEEIVMPIVETVESRLSEEAMNVDTTASGTCGENLTWTLDSEGVLTISGTGAMAAGSTWTDRGLTSVIIEEGVTSISRAAFSWNHNLINVSIPSTLTDVDTDAFFSCPNLENVYISDIAAWCNIRFVDLLSNPFYYASYMYLDGELLKDLVIPDTVTTLKSDAFRGVTNLETITIPESVTYVGYDAFYRCSSLTDIYFAGHEARWKYISVDCGYDTEQITVHYGIPNSSGTYGENVTWFHDSTTGILTVSGTGAVPNTHYSEHTPWYYIRDSITAIVVDEGITSIGNVFLDCVKAEAVQLPSTLKEIGNSAFGRCAMLTSIEIPDGVEIIGTAAFAECSNLSRMVIPSSVTDIGESVFKDCEKLTDILLPEGMTEIQESFFEGCTALSTITLPQSVECIGGYAFSGCSSLQEIQLPEKLKSIGNGAFVGCSSLQEIKLPEKLESIGDEIFYGCSSLTEASLPYGLKTITIIPRSLFYECANLTSITVPQNVTTIENWAFYGCTSLTSITLPKSLAAIEGAAFGNCNALSNVYYTGTDEQWAELLASMDPEYNAPLFNEELQVHCNWITESEEPSTQQQVLYYHSKEGNTIFFGVDKDTSFMITDETDVSSIKNLYLERYVLVETKEVDGQEILLRMLLPESAVGTVSAVSDTQITIDGKTYPVAPEVSVSQNCLNKQVVYHIYDNALAGIEVLQEKVGYLSQWVSDFRQLGMQSSATSTDYKLYRLSELCDKTSEKFLSWSATAKGQTDVTVNYLVDSNRVIYQILPLVERRETEFSAAKDGWPIVNNWRSFNYPNSDLEKYYFEPWVYYAHGYSVESIAHENIEPFLGMDWNGSCFGLSLLAIAQYTGQVDLQPYFARSGDSLNQFGYDSVVYKDVGELYALYHFEGSEPVANEAIIRKIEQAQVSFFSDEIASVEINVDTDDYSELLSYLSSNHPNPLLIGMHGASHAVVTDTSFKPIYIGNGQYLIPLYDCNTPKMPTDLNNPWKVYEYEQPMLYLNTVSKSYGYYRRGVFEEYINWDVFDELTVFDISALDRSFFDDHYSFNSVQTIITYGTFGHIEVFRVESATGEPVKIFESINGDPVSYFDGLEYMPWFEQEETDSDVQKGIVKLPAGNYIVKTNGESYVQCMYDNDIFVTGSDNGVQILLDSQEDKMTVTGAQAGTQVSLIHASSEVDFCTSAEGTVGTGEYIALSTNSENKTASADTNISPESITLKHAVDGELSEITSDMIHHHKDLTYNSAVNASCDKAGNVAHYACKCGKTFADQKASEILDNVIIPATGHTDVTIPGKAATCTATGLTEGKKCSACGEITIEQTVIPAKGHTEVINKVIAATCTKTGLTESKHCSVCNAVLVAQETIAALGHKWTAADCDTPKTCSVCKAIEGKALGHSYDDNVDGTCNSCGVNRETVEVRQVTHMLRMYNPYTGEHFYTGSEEEKDNLVAAGWQYEGVGFTFPANTGAPVYRLYDPVTGEHLYTMDEEEKATLEAAGWNYEGIAFNSAYDTEAVQHRLHNPYATVGAYHFTYSIEERDNLIAAGWEYQGIGWYSCWK